MPERANRVLFFVLTACLLAAASASVGHFLLNLNVRVFHVEHVSDGMQVHIRTPMPYLVADKIGDLRDDGLPAAAPFTTNALEDGQVVHFVDFSQIKADPLGLGMITEAGTVIEIDGKRVAGQVSNVVIHKVVTEPGFATLAEAKETLSAGSSLSDAELTYVGNVVVDMTIVYTPGVSPLRYSLSSTLDPGLPDQEMTANLILDYADGNPLVFRSRGLLNEPVEVSRSKIAGIATFIWEGVRHILEGLDHVLFVVCLVIGAPSLRDLLWRVTGFTVGHSVTLSLGFFGYVPSGAWFVPTVETGISLSIIYAAFLAIKQSRAEANTNKSAFVVTVIIGLLHGLGFSFVLQEILQVTSPSIWQSLLAFNVGVEIGQLAIVLAIWPLLWTVARFAPALEFSGRIAIAAVCGAIALWWTIERSGSVLLALSG